MNTRTLLAAMAMTALAATTANASIVVSNVQTVEPTSGFDATNYNAGTADKLVVLVAGEHNFGGSTNGDVTSITYGGVELTKAVQRQPLDSSNITVAGIWYLDDPNASGLLDATVGGNGNNYAYTILSMAGTLDGVGATGISDPNVKSVTINATGSDSTVLSMIGFGGDGNTASTSGVTANAPASTIASQVAGGDWASLVVGQTDNVGAGNSSYGFTGGAAGGNVTVAAEFLAVPEPSSLALLGLGGLLIARRRRG